MNRNRSGDIDRDIMTFALIGTLCLSVICPVLGLIVAVSI
jgi:hypothetical protein